MFRIRTSLAALLVCGACATSVEEPADGAELTAALDAAVRAHVENEMVPGVSVAVVRGADTLLMAGYGMVDLEWDVATPADGSASYEIGSVTKQFTSAAILLLAEQGHVDLDADASAYLPDFDFQGRRVPVRRLLDHSSGIKGYTEMPAFGALAGTDLPRDTLLTLVGNAPYDFEPGTAVIYNNSAYFLLGLIIEEVSGQTYEEFVEEHLFAALGMESSFYCSESEIRGDRAHGYDGSPDGLIRKRHLNHRWPYAAGSLCSSVRDLVRWNQALHGGELLTAESYEDMTTPQPLEDGSPIRYAMGLDVTDWEGRRSIAHGGGINGFLSDGRYYPEQDLIVVVLQNSTGADPGELGAALADVVLGPRPEPSAVPYSGDLDELLGSYAGPARGVALTMEVSRDGDQLVLTPSVGGDAVEPVHIGDGVWVDGRTRVHFPTGSDGSRAMHVDQVGGYYVLTR